MLLPFIATLHVPVAAIIDSALCMFSLHIKLVPRLPRLPSPRAHVRTSTHLVLDHEAPRFGVVLDPLDLLSRWWRGNARGSDIIPTEHLVVAVAAVIVDSLGAATAAVFGVVAVATALDVVGVVGVAS